MTPKTVVALFLLVIAVAGVAAVAVLQQDAPDDDGSNDDPITVPDPPEVDEGPRFPDGISYDPDTRTLSAADTVQWTVTDEFAPLYIDREPYRSLRVTAPEVTLDPGRYSVSVMGERFEVTVPGEITRVLEWGYDDGAQVHNLRIELTMDIEDFIADTEENRAWNDSVSNHMFDDLPRLVRVDDTITTLEGMLRSEYVGIGGSMDDRQGYADFLAAFVQLVTDYPLTVDNHTGEFDYAIWGCTEYWALPLETLYYLIGDCEDTAALLCSLYEAAGYRSAMGGQAGHVFAGVSIDGFAEVPAERLADLNISHYRLAERSLHVDYGRGYESVTFYAVETIRNQNPVGYLAGGDQHFDRNTMWGWAGFYPYGAVDGIQLSS